MQSVSIIVSSFNRRELLAQTIATLETSSGTSDRLERIVVDDGSQDGTQAWIRANLDDSWQPLLLKSNVGYAAANNRAAIAASGDLLIFVNGDLLVQSDWLQPILTAFAETAACFAIGNRQSAIESGELDHAGMVFLANGAPVHVRDESTDVSEFPAVTFACVAVRRDRFLALGGFDESYRNGLEDVDLCLRARMRGWPSLVAQESVVGHHVSASPGRKDAEDENQQLFQRRWHHMAVQWARDWDERLIRHRSGRRLTSACPQSGTPACARVLVDCSPLPADDSRWERLFAVLHRTEQASPERFEFHVLFQNRGLPVGGREQEDGEPRSATSATGDRTAWGTPSGPIANDSVPPSSIKLWILPGAEHAPDGNAENHRLTEVGSTLVRDLEADLLYLPFGETSHICPDIPIVSAIDTIADDDMASLECVDRLARVSYAIECHSAQVAQRLQKDFLRSVDSVFVAASENDAARELTKAFANAVKAFADSGVAWHWDPTVDAVADLPAARDVGPDEVLLQIDEPTRWDNPVPLLQIRGWCLSNTGSPVSALFVRSVDGVWEGVYGLSRPDVAAAFTDRERAATSGFVLRLPRPTRIPSEIAIEAQFAHGERVTVLRPVVGERE